MKRLTAFDHRCLRSLSHVRWFHKISNVDVRRRVLGKEGKSIDEAIKLHRLRWLGHVLRMPNHRLPRRALLADIGSGWKRASGGQTKTWHQSMKSLTVKLSQVGRCRLPGWGPRDSRNQWLETIGDMAQNRCQWRRCIQSL
nr:unnamed protein product [Trichobilharzia regenti]